jgi:hypothetical protein
MFNFYRTLWKITTNFTSVGLEAIPGTHKNYMSIAVSVQIWKFTARNNGGAARQESTTHSATNHICGTLPCIKKKQQNLGI